MIIGAVVSLAQPATYQPPWDFLSCTLPVMRVVPIVLRPRRHPAAVPPGARVRRHGAAALLAALVYATLPVIVLAHRLVKAESLLSLLFMGAILAVHRHDRSGGPGGAILAGCSRASRSGAATGVAVIAVVLVLLCPGAATVGRSRRSG